MNGLRWQHQLLTMGELRRAPWRQQPGSALVGFFLDVFFSIGAVSVWFWCTPTPGRLRLAVPVVDMFCPKTRAPTVEREGIGRESHTLTLVADPSWTTANGIVRSELKTAEEICHTNETLPCLWDVIRPDRLFRIRR